MKLFKTAAERAGQRRMDLRRLGVHATAAVSGNYAALLSCTLQKTNVRMLTQSLGDSAHHLSSNTRSNVESSAWDVVDPDGQDSGWSEQQVENLLLHADTLRGLAAGGE